MATLKQLEANRKNAQQSTGPRSAEGKAASRNNALKTGIDAKACSAIPGEDPNDLEELTSDYYRRFAPRTVEQRCLVDTLVTAEWQLRRFRLIEAQLFTQRYEDTHRPNRKFALGAAYSYLDRDLERLQHRINATQRAYLRTLTALQELRAAAPAPAPAPAEVEPDQPIAEAIGFVPKKSVVSDPGAPPAIGLEARGTNEGPPAERSEPNP